VCETGPAPQDWQNCRVPTWEQASSATAFQRLLHKPSAEEPDYCSRRVGVGGWVGEMAGKAREEPVSGAPRLRTAGVLTQRGRCKQTSRTEEEAPKATLHELRCASWGLGRACRLVQRSAKEQRVGSGFSGRVGRTGTPCRRTPSSVEDSTRPEELGRGQKEARFSVPNARGRLGGAWGTLERLQVANPDNGLTVRAESSGKRYQVHRRMTAMALLPSSQTSSASCTNDERWGPTTSSASRRRWTSLR
jgi:hypothetical protein